MSGLLHRLGAAVGVESGPDKEVDKKADKKTQAPRHAPTTARRAPFFVLIILLAVGGMALLLALNTASAANELRRHDLATKDMTVAAQLQQMRNEVAASAAPGNLGRAARALGMVPASDPAFVVIQPDGSIKVLGKPGAAQGAPLPMAPRPKSSKLPKSTATATPTSTAKATATSTATSTATASKTAATKSRSGRHTPSSSNTPTPTPTPTPTSTITLPGGDR